MVGRSLRESALARRMNADIAKFRKAYSILLKQHTCDARRQRLHQIMQAQLALRGSIKAKKTDLIRSKLVSVVKHFAIRVIYEKDESYVKPVVER